MEERGLTPAMATFLMAMVSIGIYNAVMFQVWKLGLRNVQTCGFCKIHEQTSIYTKGMSPKRNIHNDCVGKQDSHFGFSHTRHKKENNDDF